MYVKNSIEQWDQIIEEFKSYDATATEFCKEKKISKSQFYYHRKRLSHQQIEPTLCEVELAKVSTPINPKNAEPSSKYIKIEINNAIIHIPTSEATLLTTIIKELSATC